MLYPFYNFDREEASKVILLPMAIMDGALNDEILHSERSGEEIISDIEKYNLLVKNSGYSILWHNTALTGTEFSNRIKKLYWQYIKKNKERCMPCIDVVRKLNEV